MYAVMIMIWLIGHMFTFGLYPINSNRLKEIMTGFLFLLFWPIALGVYVRENS